MKNLEQNNLANATTDLGFVKVVNENANELGTSEIALQKEVVLEDGNTVKVEGITPSKMKAVLNEQANNTITYQTPGENFEKTFEEGTIKGIVQDYNDEVKTQSENAEILEETPQIDNTDDTVVTDDIVNDTNTSDNTVDDTIVTDDADVIEE